jgi:hypothetical protein
MHRIDPHLHVRPQRGLGLRHLRPHGLQLGLRHRVCGTATQGLNFSTFSST